MQQITIALRPLTAVPVPAGFPAAKLTSLDVSDVSGRVCGAVAAGEVELSFEAGEDGRSALIEDPADPMGSWATHPYLSGVLEGSGVAPEEYLVYLRDVISAADAAFRTVSAQALALGEPAILAAING